MTEPLARFSGPTSWFGGPNDTGVAPDEGLAFFYEVDDAPHLFLATQPAGTSGLARRLDPDEYYVACRWDYDVTPKDMLRRKVRALVKARATGRQALAYPADWGPHEDTGRYSDISPGLMSFLGLETDDDIEVIYPAPDELPVEGPPIVTVSLNVPEGVEVEVYINGERLDDPD